MSEELIPLSNKQGFLVRNRVDAIGLLPSWTNVPNIGVDVLITEK